MSDLIEDGREKGLISFDDEEKYITYIHQKKIRNYSNPEEKIQAFDCSWEDLC